MALKHNRSRITQLPELRKIQAVIQSLEAKGVEKIDAIGHSEGGIDVAFAAKLYPDKFRNIILVNPGGMIGQDKIVNLIARCMMNFLSDTKRDIAEKIKLMITNAPSDQVSFNMREGMHAIIFDMRKSYEEIPSISRADIRETLKQLKKKEIGISIIAAVDDKAFPMERMQKMINESIKKDTEGNLDMLDGFYSTKGSHVELLRRPALYSRLVDTALDDLERRQKGRKISASL